MQFAAAKKVYQEQFAGNAVDVSKQIAFARSRMDPNSAQFACFLEDVATAWPCFKVRNTLVIPIIEEAIAIRKRRSGAYADSDPSIACDKVLIACRLASIDGDYIGPAKDAYNIFQKFSVPGSASLKPFSREILKLSYILAYELRARAKEMATLASSNFDPGSPSLGEDWYSLGLFYEKLGEYAKSITAYETSYNVDNARKSTNALCSARAMAKVLLS